MHTIPQNIDALKQQLAEAVHKSPLAQTPPRLIAVSKKQPAERIKSALDAGQRDFGENQVQEAEQHWADVRAEYAGLYLHLIGPLQSNKTAEAVRLFDVIHTVDRKKIAHAIRDEMTKQQRKVECLIQVNTGAEPQKAGVSVEALPDLLAYCASIDLPICGLMCIPPAGQNPAPHFTLLVKLAERHGIKELSMGMSGDYETAARLGATYVRVGTAIFGERFGQ